MLLMPDLTIFRGSKLVMRITDPNIPSFIGRVGVIGLTACGHACRAASEVIEKAKQTAALALYEARQSGSVDQARESLNQVLDNARQQAAEATGTSQRKPFKRTTRSRSGHRNPTWQGRLCCFVSSR
jgi:hypothetical protein